MTTTCARMCTRGLIIDIDFLDEELILKMKILHMCVCGWFENEKKVQ